MPDAAPRYDPRLLQAVAAVDDPRDSMAETCRRVALVAEGLELSRPSVVHLRTYVAEHRRAQAAVQEQRRIYREIALEMAAGMAAGRIPHAYAVEERVVRRARG